MELFFSKDNSKRQLALISEDYVLIFKTGSEKINDKIKKTPGKPETYVIVESVSIEKFKQDKSFFSNEKNILTSRHGFEFEGFLGFFKQGDGNIFLGLIKHSKTVANSRWANKTNLDTGKTKFVPLEAVKQILNVEFICLTSSAYDNYQDFEQKINSQATKDTAAFNGSDNNPLHPCYEFKKLFCDGSFYFSRDFDITNFLQNRGSEIFSNNLYGSDNKSSIKSTSMDFILEKFQEKYVWNIKIIEELINLRARISKQERRRMDNGMFITFVIRGFAESKLLNNNNLCLTTITRISTEGRDETLLDSTSKITSEGNISSFMETEVIISIPGHVMSYVMCLGNIPINYGFQESQFLIHSKKKLDLTYSKDNARNEKIMEKHFDKLSASYGDVSCINLTKAKDPGQAVLNNLYLDLLQKSDKNMKFFSLELKKPLFKKIADKNVDFENLLLYDKDFILADSFSSIKQNIMDFGCFVYDNVNGIFSGKQTGVIRLSTTSKNFVNNEQDMSNSNHHSLISSSSVNSIKKMFLFIKLVTQEVFEMIFKEMGMENHITNEIFYDSTQNAYANLFKSQIFQIVNILDRNSQHHHKKAKIYNQLFSYKLKLYDPLHSYVTSYLNFKIDNKELTYKKKINIFTVTFNVAGIQYKDDLQDLLFPHKKIVRQEIEEETLVSVPKYKDVNEHDIYCIGLEEVIDLTPGKMINTDANVKTIWAKNILKTLNKESNEKYTILGMQQLGGIIMYLFIKVKQIPLVTSVQYAFHKLGFGGIAANKGAVAISVQYSTTKICFITSHLSAGLGNMEQRHIDYKMVIENVSFGNKNININSHNGIIWLGDLNYRINSSNEEVKQLILAKNYKTLLMNDQLHKQMIDGESFPFFEEMEIKFPPTYKFDKNTNTYDTSEKNRIPAWTDRILSKGVILTQKCYDSIPEVMFSDHKPVFASFQADVTIVDEKLKLKLMNSIYSELQRELEDYDINEKLLILELAEKDLLSANKNHEANKLKLIKNKEDTLKYYGEPENFENDKIYLKPYYNPYNQKLPAPSNDHYKWWIGDANKPAVIDINIDTSKYILNPDRTSNPFDETLDNPIFIKPKA
ncbi:hypothetical protein QEN19_004115 [Hanseniaspora menglaensis]